jgi:hypothetical protein
MQRNIAYFSCITQDLTFGDAWSVRYIDHWQRFDTHLAIGHLFLIDNVAVARLQDDKHFVATISSVIWILTLGS